MRKKVRYDIRDFGPAIRRLELPFTDLKKSMGRADLGRWIRSCA